MLAGCQGDTFTRHPSVVTYMTQACWQQFFTFTERLLPTEGGNAQQIQLESAPWKQAVHGYKQKSCASLPRVIILLVLLYCWYAAVTVRHEE